jgi:hypothetical protein
MSLFTGGLEDSLTPWLDPALRLHLISQCPPMLDTPAIEPLSTVGLPSPPSSSQKTLKARCVNAPCAHIAAGSCTNQMCKSCCEKLETAVCFFKNHNRGRRPVSISDNPAHLARPLPQEPLRSISAAASVPLGSDASTFALGDTPLKELEGASFVNQDFSGAFSFRKPVPLALAEDYKRRREEREIRQQAELSRNENERRMKHSVLLVAYLQEDGQPTMFPLQDIKTWPTLNLSQLMSLPSQLGLSDLTNFCLFDPQNAIWIPTVDHAFPVTTNQKIYMRRRELVMCGPTSSSLNYSPTSFEPSRSSQKRRADGAPDHSSSPAHSTISARRGYSHDYAGLSSAPSSPSRFSSPPTDCDDDIGASPNPDLEWEFGTVPTPKGVTTIWPQGMYVRDMAKGFDLLQLRESGQTVASWFSEVFLGMVWKESMYHKNRKFWLGLSVNTQQQACRLPRTQEGLWTVWRKSQPTWS